MYAMMRKGSKDITKQVTTSCVVTVKVFSLSLCPDSEPVGFGEPCKPFNKRCFFCSAILRRIQAQCRLLSVLLENVLLR